MCLYNSGSKYRKFIIRTVSVSEGIAALEFALILPFLLILIFGIIEFSFLMYDQQVLTNACREGVRAGIVQQIPRVSDGEIESIVNNYCGTNLITFGAQNTPTVTVERVGDDFGDDLLVRVQYHYDFLVFSKFVGSSYGGKNLTAKTVMRME